MKSVHLVISDLFLPKDIAAEACAELHLPALEKLLGRGHSEILPAIPLEDHLCRSFGMTSRGDAPVATVSAAFDGLPEGFWLRADPVHMRLQREQMLLLPNPDITADEAVEMCASLNEHFAGQGIEFFAPHPLRWYVRFDVSPVIETVPLSQALGRNVHGLLPGGAEGTHWHQMFNEIQMLLYAHPLNETREQRGKLTINSVWFWGGGCDTLLAKPADCGNSHQAAPVVSDEIVVASYGGGYGAVASLQKNFQSVQSDDVLTEMLAVAAGVPFAAWTNQWKADSDEGTQLLVWTGLRSALQRGDLAAWRAALQDFETGYAQPLWQALRSGKIAQMQMDTLGEDYTRRASLKRGDTWAFWRRIRRLAGYSLV